MYRINEEFEKIKNLFSSNNKKFVFDSIIEGKTPGRIYVNNEYNPELYVIFDGGNFVLYLGGETDNLEEYEKCVSYIRESILTEELRKFGEWITISYTSNIWKNKLLDVLKGLTIEQDKRVLYRYNIENTPNDNEFDLFFQVKAIDENILNNSELENIEELLDEISGMWGNTEEFVKNGFGYCALYEEKLISWCTGEFFSEKTCGIGIYTIEEERKKGVAAALTRSFVTECSKRGLVPYWDSWDDNAASIKVAEKVGFDRVEVYEVMGVKF